MNGPVPLPVRDPTSEHWRDFTLERYRALVNRTRSLYHCVGFEILDRPIEDAVGVAIIRHDVDMAPYDALNLARIEAEAGVRATYTVLLTSPFYSPFEPEIRDLFRTIASLGHDIGLHFDAAWHGIDDETSLEEALGWEASVLRRLLGVPVEMSSFHNTTPFSMGCHGVRYAGLRNAYAGVLQREVSYLSDSNGCWHFRSWEQALDEHPPRLQVLTHPEWWTAAPASPAAKVCALLDGRAGAVWDYYRDLLARGPRPNYADVPLAMDRLPALLGNTDILRMWLSGRRRAAFLELFDELPRRRADLPSSPGWEALAALHARLAAGEAVDDIALRDAFEESVRLLDGAA